MEKFSIEFWVVIQMVIDLILVMLILYFLRHLRSGIQQDISKEAAKQLTSMIEPILQEADSAAKTFEVQLKEKNRLINNLNERLDSKIISLNLLLNRSEAHLSSGADDGLSGQSHVYDQQQTIIDLYQKGHDSEIIAGQLSMPKGEVDLVIDLKKKFLEMEQKWNR